MKELHVLLSDTASLGQKKIEDTRREMKIAKEELHAIPKQKVSQGSFKTRLPKDLNYTLRKTDHRQREWSEKFRALAQQARHGSDAAKLNEILETVLAEVEKRESQKRRKPCGTNGDGAE